MSNITAVMVRDLRAQTGAGMMACKKALVETQGDLEEAVVLLRKQGEAKAEKRSSRVAAEGKIVTAVSDNAKQAIMIEVNCETDFVARDNNFIAFCDKLAEKGLAERAVTVDALLALANDQGETVEQQRKALVSQIGENINVRRVVFVESDYPLGIYNHGNALGAMVTLDVDNAELAKDIAMHVTASNPVAIDETGVDEALVEKEKQIFTAQAKESGKPDEIIAKMIDGRIKKYLKEICLVHQPFVKNPDETVAQLLKSSSAHVTELVRYELGEGIEKVTVDFADEVSAQVKGS